MDFGTSHRTFSDFVLRALVYLDLCNFTTYVGWCDRRSQAQNSSISMKISSVLSPYNHIRSPTPFPAQHESVLHPYNLPHSGMATKWNPSANSLWRLSSLTLHFALESMGVTACIDNSLFLFLGSVP